MPLDAPQYRQKAGTETTPQACQSSIQTADLAEKMKCKNCDLPGIGEIRSFGINHLAGGMRALLLDSSEADLFKYLIRDLSTGV